MLQEVSLEVSEMTYPEPRALVVTVQCAADVGEWLWRLWDHVARKTRHTVTRVLCFYGNPSSGFVRHFQLKCHQPFVVVGDRQRPICSMILGPRAQTKTSTLYDSRQIARPLHSLLRPEQHSNGPIIDRRSTPSNPTFPHAITPTTHSAPFLRRRRTQPASL